MGPRLSRRVPVGPGAPSVARCGAHLAVTAVGAALIAAAVMALAGAVDFPAYPGSGVLRALTTVAQVVTVLLAAALVWAARRGEAGRDLGRLPAAVLSRAARIGLPLTSGLMVTATLAIPLSATRLYLDGVSVDQEFRSQFLARSATDAGLPDMTYADLPSFYPSGWFWLGGRLAALLGRPGWEMFQPWSVLSLSVAAAVATALWTCLLRTDRGALAGLAVTATVLAEGSAEPYGALVLLLAGPVLLSAWHAVAPSAPGLGRRAAVAVALALGLSACVYTLYTGVLAAAVVLMAVVAAVTRRSRPGGVRVPLLRLVAIGAGAAVVALLVWAPYLLARLGGSTSSSGTALHYLPRPGTLVPMPWEAGGVPGALCTLGALWLAVRAVGSRRAQALGLGVLAAYGWILASMLATLAGTTLLGYRVTAVVHVLLAAAGALAAVELAETVSRRMRRPAGGADADLAVVTPVRPRAVSVTAGITVVALTLGVGAAQHALTRIEPMVTTAYTDADGTGTRADRADAGDEGLYPRLVDTISELTGRPATDTVVLAYAPGLLSFTPYLGYQAVTSHYANPLGRFDERTAAIRSWAGADTPEELWSAITSTAWRRPDVLVARTDRLDDDGGRTPVDDGYVLRVAEDRYPNDPNVEFTEITIPRSAVGGPHMTVREVGPFAVIALR